MQYSHSRVECSMSCPYKFKLRYVDKVETIIDYAPDNALVCGNTIHTGAEKDVAAALKFYKSNYYVIDNAHINEMIKFEYLIPKVKEILADINIYAQEYFISTPRFRGIVDLITKNDDGTIDVFDFKYSNNIEHYLESPQLHIYKYFLEQQGFKIKNLGFIFIPKISIRQKKEEDLFQFRQRLNQELEQSEIKLMKVEYDAHKVVSFMDNIINIKEMKDYPRNQSNLCSWCEYEKYCYEGVDYMLLPKNERRDIRKANKKKIWVYGPAFSGKTTMLDDAPNPLNLNTDGNIEFVTMPYIAIKDEITVEGRITKRKFAWEVFKDTIAELEKKQNEFETIIVDLLEDTREMCRVYKYDELGIQHESDSGYGKGWDIIKTEYLTTIRRVFNLDYENIIVLSHEDVSKDITKKNGQNITKIAPNIQDAISNKVAGMVDIVARVVVDGDERTLNFKSDEVIFGGGRLKGITSTSIPLAWDELMKVYEQANVGKSEVKEEKISKRNKKKGEPDKPMVHDVLKESGTPSMEDHEKEVVEDKPKGSRKSNKKDVEKLDKDQVEKVGVEPPIDGEMVDVDPKEDKPKRRTRKKKGEE